MTDQSIEDASRYQVREESSILGNLFQIYDGHEGVAVGQPKYFKDEADRIAKRLNLSEANYEL
jgi:hypothetical protein